MEIKRLTKRERIKLLLMTRLDALGETANSEGHGQFGSRSLQHGDLWNEGSYRELERLLDEMRHRCKSIHWHTLNYWAAKDRQWRPGMKPRSRCAQLGLDWLERRMGNVYVPQSISENAGFHASEAATYAKPRSLQRAA